MSDVILTENECEILGRAVFGNLDDYTIAFQINKIGKDPIGFLGNHYELNVTINEKSDNRKVSTSKFFLKTIPKIKAHSDYVEEIGVFRKEALLFKSLMPKLQNATSFLKNQWSPKCFLVKENVLVFENLSCENFKMSENKVLDFNHCKAVVKTLAEFHSASIILEVKENISINKEYSEEVKESAYIFEDGHTRNKWLLSGIDGLVTMCTMIQRENEATLLPTKVMKAVSKFRTQPDYQNVLSHGDLWINNFMFKYENNKLEKSILVDFQLARYAPAALDVMCCLHLVTSNTIRDNHLLELLSIYYNHLGKVLEQSGISIEKIMTEKIFFEECNYYKLAALAEACLFGLSIWLPISAIDSILNCPMNCKEFTLGDKSSIITKAFYDDEFYRNKMTMILNEFLDYKN